MLGEGEWRPEDMGVAWSHRWILGGSRSWGEGRWTIAAPSGSQGLSPPSSSCSALYLAIGHQTRGPRESWPAHTSPAASVAGAPRSGLGSAATGSWRGSTGSAGACTTAACATAASSPRASASWSSPARTHLPSRAPSLQSPARCPRWASSGLEGAAGDIAQGPSALLTSSLPSRSWTRWPEAGRSATPTRWTDPTPHTHR